MEALRLKWAPITEVLNIARGERPEEGASNSSLSQLQQSTAESLQSLRKEDLLGLLNSLGRRQSASLRKQQLIEKILELKLGVANGSVQLNIAQEPEVCEQQQSETLSQNFRLRLFKASLEAWFMKPLISTAGMKEGSFNERQILDALPAFFIKHIVHRVDQSSSPSSMEYRVQYLCTVGLVGAAGVKLLAGSPDGIVAISDENGDVFVAAIEIKTMTSVNTIENAERLRDSHSEITYISDIGRSTVSTQAFKELVPNTSYRLQCLHNSAVLGKPRVIFTVGKGSTMGVGQIIYTAILEFSSNIIASYIYCISSIRRSCFEWIGKDSKDIPKEYDSMLQATQAADLFSFCSFYNLSKAYKKLANEEGPLPPARMIRPSCLVFWNHAKGGVDEFSRALKSLCYTNSSENPIVSVIGRLICAQVSNAAIVHRFSLAMAKGYLPGSADENPGGSNKNGYHRLRHEVARCETFSSFARFLAREFVQSSAEKDSSEPEAQFTVSIKPFYVKDAATKYNRATHAERRLTNISAHKKTKFKTSYCSLCSYNFQTKLFGKVYKKKGGSRERQWCSVCRQPVCSKCWDIWHTELVLSVSRGNSPRGG